MQMLFYTERYIAKMFSNLESLHLQTGVKICHSMCHVNDAKLYKFLSFIAGHGKFKYAESNLRGTFLNHMEKGGVNKHCSKLSK